LTAGVLAVFASFASANCASARSGPIVLGIGGVSTVRVGQIVKLALPSDQSSWSVTFDESKLRPLTGAGQVSPPDGWTWQALEPGRTDIVLTGRPKPCPTGPCGPTMPQMTVSVDIVKN
jgi:hypothetical protein